VILSDVSIREELAAGRIVIDPLDDKDVQPSSVDLRVDRFFRVFRNDTTPYIDPKQSQEDLTELVEVPDGKAFILHPGEFVLGSTLERVVLPDDLVARLEGKSSLGRLGLLIHSSLPGSEPVVVLHKGRVEAVPIETVVRKRLDASVVGFDPETLETRFFPITGWYEGPPDRIWEIRLASGRRVRVTAGHNLFTLDRDGEVVEVRTGQIRPGTRIAVPRRLPEPDLPAPTMDLCQLVPEEDYGRLVVQGPTIAAAFDDPNLVSLLRTAGVGHVDFYRQRAALPYAVAGQIPGLPERLGDDELRGKGTRQGFPIRVAVDTDLAWLLGLYVAGGHRRRNHVVISSTDPAILDRAQAVLARLGQPMHRRAATAITWSSEMLSALLGWLGTGGDAHSKRLPAGVLGWPPDLLEALLNGLMDGGGSRDRIRDSYWSGSPGLVDDILLLALRLGRRTAVHERAKDGSRLFQVVLPHHEHKLLLSVPLPDRLLLRIREELGLSQRRAGTVAGSGQASDLNNIERRGRRDAVRVETLRRLRDTFREVGDPPSLTRLSRLIDGDLAWDTVLEVQDTGEAETIFDLEVRPEGRQVENFVAGSGGVLVSNTAGFVDAGWDGHLTLELSNVANLPIAIYPGMKIGQISFIRMTSPAERPYGSRTAGSKYQGQQGPTASRYYLNFEEEKAESSDLNFEEEKAELFEEAESSDEG
jgi:deoxycytidine triphosphate deaminase